VSTRRKPQRPSRVHAVTSTGIRIESKHRYHANLQVLASGEHLWCLYGMWRVKDPTAEQFDLDIENLLTIEGPGCFICEQPYTPELAARPCTGTTG